MKQKYPYLNKELEIYELENGHKIILGYKEGALINVSSWVATGSINEDDQNNGVSHFLEHLMFKGTKNHPAGEFDRILERKGAIINAATWKDYTFYYVTVPKEHLNLAIELHADMMTNPLLPEKEIGPIFDVNDKNVKEKRERYVVIEEIKMREDQPWSKVYNTLNFNMYDSHPYKRDVIGTPQIIAGIKQSEIMDYYNKHYTPKNITTIVIGDIDFEKTLEKLKSEFKFKSDVKKEEHNLIHEHRIAKEKYFEQSADINTGYFMRGFLAPDACELKDALALDLISIILGEGKSSRLNKNLIEKVKKPIFNYIGTQQYHFRDGNNFFIQANFTPENKQKAINEINKQMNDFLNSQISEEELNKAKKKMMVRFAENAETVSDIAETIGFYYTVCKSLEIVNEYEPMLKKLDAPALIEVARKYLQKEHSVTSILIPRENKNEKN